MNKIKNSLSKKILSVLAIVFIGITIISSIAVVSLIKDTVYKLEQDKVTLIAKNHAPLMAMNLFLGMQEHLDTLVDNIMQNEGVLQVSVYNKINLIVEKSRDDISQGIDVSVPIYNPNSKEEIGILKVIYSTNQINILLDKYFIYMVVSILVIILIFIWLNLYIKKILSPLRDLALILKNYSPDIGIDIPYLDQENEIGLISNAMNSSYKKILEYSNNLQELTQELQFNNNNLEKKVKQEVAIIKQKDQQLLQQSRLAQMGEMISMIAHQWRQPLSAISSAVIGIQTKLSIGKFNLEKSEDRDKFFELLDQKHKNINEYVQTLSETIDDFRNFFKPDKEKEKVCLSDPIEKALKIVSNSMINKGIEIVCDFKTEDRVLMYQNELMQVILNILKNSEDNFIDKNIQNGKIYIKNFKTVKNYVVEISDNGGGIPENIISKIFDPYFSTKDEKNGTGLGLYMSKIMIEDHHRGELSVSNIDDGVCFKIKLKGSNNV